MIRRASPGGAKTTESAHINFDLQLRSWDVYLTFADGTTEVLKVQARCPLSAVRLSSYTPERDWSAEKRLSVTGIEVVRVS